LRHYELTLHHTVEKLPYRQEEKLAGIQGGMEA